MTDKCNSLSLEDRLWIAGFFDGEGCAVYGYFDPSKTRHLRVAIDQKEREILDWIQKVTGIGTVHPTKTRGCFRWQAHGQQALSFLEEIEFYIKTKNHRERIEHVLSEMEKDGRL